MSEAGVFELPSLGADMETGTLLEWYVTPGDTVERGSIVALVATDKADIDVEIWEAGTVSELLIDVDTEVPVGTPILRLSPGSVAPAPSPTVASDLEQRVAPAARTGAITPVGASEEQRVAPAARTGAITPVGASEEQWVAPAAPAGDVVPASPYARALAIERGIDLRSVTGTGPGGAVVARDLEAVAVASDPVVETAPFPPVEETAPSPPVGDRTSAMRQAIALRMATANTEIPHYYLEHDIDVGPMLSRLERHNRSLSVAERVLPAAMLLKATAAAAAKVPELNGFWVGDRFEPASSTDLAVVVSLRRGGLVTPRIRDVDQLDADGVMASLTEIVTGARRGSMRSSWMSGAGLTVTNLGERGVDRISGVIFPPQVALVGFGAIRERPWVVCGAVEPRPVVTASLAADHRATDGAIGARFLTALADHLQGLEDT